MSTTGRPLLLLGALNLHKGRREGPKQEVVRNQAEPHFWARGGCGRLGVVSGRRGPTFDVARARALYESGMTAKEVGAVLGVSKDAICTHLSRLKVIRQGPLKKPHVSTERIVQLRDQGTGWTEIGAAVGITAGSVRARYWAANGVRRIPGQPFNPPKAPLAPKPDPPPAKPKAPRWSDEQLLELKALGASHRQVAEATGLTYGAVATRLYRARRRHPVRNESATHCG